MSSISVATWIGILVSAVVAHVVALVALPRVIRFATARRLLDHPDGIRRSHDRPVPRLGGVGVFFGFAVALTAMALVQWPGFIPAGAKPVAVIVGASFALFALGLRDDLVGVPPLGKLSVQAATAIAVWAAGFRLDHLAFPPGLEFSLGWLSLPVTVLWLVGISNAFNLIDGLDGLAGGVAITTLLAAAASAALLGLVQPLWYAVTLGGALLAFLRYNRYPARIFLGDSGSLVVGFLLGVLTPTAASRPDGATYALVPIFALSYPLLDTGISMLRRWLRGHPLSRADERHIHHQLRSLGLSTNRAVGMIVLHSAVVAALGLSAAFAPPALTLAVAIAGGTVLVFILVYGLRWLQYHEFLEAGASVASVARNARGVLQDKINARDIACLIGNARTLDEVEEILQANRQVFRFAHVALQRGATPVPPPADVLARARCGQLWKLDIWVPVGTDGEASMMQMQIWSTVGSPGHTSGAERIALVLARAVAAWAQEHATAVEAGAIWQPAVVRAAAESSGRRVRVLADAPPAPPSPRLEA
jgi:UDP-GlcNAc:undecaprenyl-phosphate GlcNAc-1-phosphate transferase